MNRFTLVRDRWYACEFIGDEFTCQPSQYSPIKVLGLAQMNDGGRRFQLDFYHACYPAGVRDKAYQLQTLERGERFLLAISLEHQPKRLLQIYSINARWIESHLGQSVSDDGSKDAVQRWLDMHA